MINVRCIRCGVVNVVADEVCKVCGAELAQPFRGPVNEPKLYQPQPRLNDLIKPFKRMSDVLVPTINLFANNVWLITKIVFVIVAPFETFKVFSFHNTARDLQLAIGLFVLDLACKALIAPALIYALMTVIKTGDAPGVTESYRFGIMKLPKLAASAAVAGLLQMLGFCLLIIPGVIIGLALELVYPIAVLENRSVSDTLRRSRDLTQGYRRDIFFAGLVLMVLVSFIDVPLSMFFPVSAVWPLALLSAIIQDVLKQATTVLSLVIYLSILRTLESGQSVIK